MAFVGVSLVATYLPVSHLLSLIPHAVIGHARLCYVVLHVPDTPQQDADTVWPGFRQKAEDTQDTT